MAKHSTDQQSLWDTSKDEIRRDDCLMALDKIPDESVDLVYIDPPFFSQRFYEVIWGDEQERYAFEDRWKGGRETYITYLVKRCRKLHAKLKPTGLMYLHLDWHISHYMKVQMDEIFGYNNFRNEIIWCYRGGGVPRNDFARKHDNIFRYSKSGEYYFDLDSVRIPYSDDVLASPASRYDKSYRKNKVYEGYRPNIKGKHPEDWWQIQPIMPSDKTERLGYPTQKPLALLDQIVRSSCPPDGVVLDAFCGCGTTVEAAINNKRRYIGIEISQAAINVIHDRIEKLRLKDPTIQQPVYYGMIHNEEQLTKPNMSWKDFQVWAVSALDGQQMPRNKFNSDMGMDGLTGDEEPIQVKQSQGVGREVVDNLSGVLRRRKTRRGIIVAFSFSRGAMAEVSRLEREDGIKIRLVTCSQLIHGRPPRISVQSEKSPVAPDLVADRDFGD